MQIVLASSGALPRESGRERNPQRRPTKSGRTDCPEEGAESREPFLEESARTPCEPLPSTGLTWGVLKSPPKKSRGTGRESPSPEKGQRTAGIRKEDSPCFQRAPSAPQQTARCRVLPLSPSSAP